MMQSSDMWGGNCGCGDYEMSEEDRKAYLKEKEAILEAKLATVRHMIQTSDKPDSGKA